MLEGHHKALSNEADFDVIIIGAGMSGLACAIRLAMYNYRVIVLESHAIAGGLNSYYQRGRYPLDVGLHAMTNFAPKGHKGPLGKMLKQLRLSYDDFDFIEQKKSTSLLANEFLDFSNQEKKLFDEIKEKFPQEEKNFSQLWDYIKNFNEFDPQNPRQSAKEKLATFIQDQKLIELLIFPLLVYGSSWEEDMEFVQFVIMFKAIYLEGFMRPRGGVRGPLKLLTDKIEKLGGRIAYKCPVKKILSHKNKAIGVELENGDQLFAKQVFSSAGALETWNLCQFERPLTQHPPLAGQLSFVESILIFDQEFKSDYSIRFWSNRSAFHYRCPDQLIDPDSAVVCFPNHFNHNDLNFNCIKVTMLANHALWKSLSKEDYKKAKDMVFNRALEVANLNCPDLKHKKVIFKDVFTPKTVERYTRHTHGAIYGSSQKSTDGYGPLENLFLIGNDQGLVGIIGTLLSGVSMANKHVLSKELA